jgi:hypothetical protein
MPTLFSKVEIENTQRVLSIKLQEQQRKVDEAEKLVKEEKDKVAYLKSLLIELVPQEVTFSIKPMSARTGPTFKEWVLKILSDGKPRTSRQLYEEYIKIQPESGLKGFYDFSGRFANITKGIIKKHKVEENSMAKRYFYGLAEWFDGENLKQEYFNKIIL